VPIFVAEMVCETAERRRVNLEVQL
jgi:hypothetical protein